MNSLKNIEQELIKFARAHEIVEAVCHGGMRFLAQAENGNYTILTKLSDTKEDFGEFESEVKTLEKSLREKYTPNLKLEALPFGGWYKRNFRECVYSEQDNSTKHL